MSNISSANVADHAREQNRQQQALLATSPGAFGLGSTAAGQSVRALHPVPELESHHPRSQDSRFRDRAALGGLAPDTAGPHDHIQSFTTDASATIQNTSIILPPLHDHTRPAESHDHYDGVRSFSPSTGTGTIQDAAVVLPPLSGPPTAATPPEVLVDGVHSFTPLTGGTTIQNAAISLPPLPTRPSEPHGHSEGVLSFTPHASGGSIQDTAVVLPSLPGPPSVTTPAEVHVDHVTSFAHNATGDIQDTSILLPPLSRPFAATTPPIRPVDQIFSFTPSDSGTIQSPPIQMLGPPAQKTTRRSRPVDDMGDTVMDGPKPHHTSQGSELDSEEESEVKASRDPARSRARNARTRRSVASVDEDYDMGSEADKEDDDEEEEVLEDDDENGDRNEGDDADSVTDDEDGELDSHRRRQQSTDDAIPNHSSSSPRKMTVSQMEAYLEEQEKSLRRQEKQQAALNNTLRNRRQGLPGARRQLRNGATSAGGPGSRHRWGRPRMLDKVSKPDDFIQHRAEIDKRRSALIRSCFLELMQETSSADIRFNFTASNVHGDSVPSRNNFWIDWSTTNKEAWNRAAINILTDYVREKHPAEWLGVLRKTTRTKVRKHIDHLRVYRKARQRLRQRANLALLDSAKSRQRALMYRRLAVLAEYRLMPGMEKIFQFFCDMGMDGTSSDEESESLTNKYNKSTYRVHSIHGMAPEVVRAKDKIDLVYIRYVKPKYPAGSDPRHRVRGGRESARRKHRYSLAENAYDVDWIDSLLDIERRDLGRLPTISFAPLDDLLE